MNERVLCLIVLVQDKRIKRALNHPLNKKLTQLRDPSNGRINMKLPFPTSSAGPAYRFHYDQYEKLWLFGIMIYAGRDGYSRYVPSCNVLRNKHSSSILLSCLSGINHLCGLHPYSIMFDGGTEGAAFQQHFKEKVGCGDERVLKRTSKANNVIEGWWIMLFEGEIWLIRIEGFHLIFCNILNVNDPLHLSAFWAAYASDVQRRCDEYASTYSNDRLMYAINI